MSASPEQLRLMLIEGAIKFCHQGLDGLERKDYERMCDGFSRCRNILLELSSSVRPDVDAELAKQVSGLYTFMYLHLVDAGFERDRIKARKVIDLLEYERETWVKLMDKLEEERRTPGSAALTSTSPTGQMSSRPALSVQG